MKKIFLTGIALVLIVSFGGTALALPTIISYDNHTFYQHALSTQLYEIVITDDLTTPVITADNDIRLTLPEDFLAIFDTERTELELEAYGTAVDNGKVSADPDILFENDDRTVVIPVDADFETGESVAIRQLSVEGFYNLTPSGQYLQLTYHPEVDLVRDTKYLSITTGTLTDITAPGPVTNVEISQPTESSIKLTWNDPADQDLFVIQVLRSEDFYPINADPYDEIAPGIEEYTETGLSIGDVVNFQLRANDGRNLGDVTEIFTHTMVELEEEVITEPDPVVEEESEFCTLEYAPVCSMNGVTYPNECTALKNDAVVNYESECEPTYCSIEDSFPVCGVDGVTYPNPCSLEKSDITKAYDGVCDVTYCIAEWAPVCGADEETYASQCVLEKNDVELLHEGECITDPLFSDIETHTLRTEIEAMVEKGVINGKTTTEFEPEGTLLRAEAAALLYRVLGLDEDPLPPLDKPFEDVDQMKWYAPHVAELKGLTLIEGTTTTTFSPTQTLNRAEFVVLAMRTYHHITDTGTPLDQEVTEVFTDDLPAWGELQISEAADLGFIDGTTEEGLTYFNGGEDLPRAEAAEIMYDVFYDLL
jgi:hypothetical protein